MMSKTDRCAQGIRAAFAAFLLFFSHAAQADGIPQPWGLGLQTPGTPISSRINDFHDMLLVIITGVVILVFVLLVYVCIRFRKNAHPVPTTTTHNVKLEIVWTLLPCLIVLVIACTSFPLLYFIDRMPTPDMTMKVTGHQWYWSYEYPDQKVAFDSVAIWNAPDVTDEQAAKSVAENSSHWLIPGEAKRMLEVDNRVVLPVGKVVRVQITGADVLHSWFVSSLGVNRMAVTGRLNEVWLKIDKPGIYYGQCSMICGTGHGFMPIVIEAVPQDQFDAWANSKKTASLPATPVALK